MMAKLRVGITKLPSAGLRRLEKDITGSTGSHTQSPPIIINGVGPNAINLRETSRPSRFYKIPLWVAEGVEVLVWVFCPAGFSPSRDSSFGIAGDQG
jgi:hypothetical protein